jgi:glycosyltransferase involved in cell wall biosynthesis
MDIVGGVVARLTSVPWVISERSSESAYRHSVFLWLVRPYLARYAKAIISNSAEGAEYWTRRIRSGKHVYTISNSVDFPAIRGSLPLFPKSLRDTRQILLFVGRFQGEKAPEVFVRAVGRLPEQLHVRALLVGDGPLREELRASIASLGLEQRVSLLPYQANWWGLLRTAAALISTSRYEGQPNVVLEAMAGECPLIVSDIRAHRALLDERSALFVPSDNPVALAKAIVSLLSDPQAARRRADRAAERVSAFTIQAAADAYERVYARVLDGKAA